MKKKSIVLRQQSILGTPHSSNISISSAASYSLPLKVLSDLLTRSIAALRATNKKIETTYSRSQQAYTGLSLESSISLILDGPEHRVSHSDMLYSIYGQRTVSLKAAANRRSEIVAHLNMMLSNLTQRQKENRCAQAVTYCSEAELFRAFLKVFHRKLFESPLFRKVRDAERYPSLGLQRTVEGHRHMSSQRSQLRLSLSQEWDGLEAHVDAAQRAPRLVCTGNLRDIDQRVELPAASRRIRERPAAHPQTLCRRKVFSHSYPRDSRKTFYVDLNEIDIRNNTALMLATVLRRKDCVRVLCDHCADPNFKPFAGSVSPIEYAVGQSDRELLLMLVGSVQRAKKNGFERHRAHLIDSLESLPNLSLELDLHCDSSFIPFVKAFAPSDTYRICKRGSSLRIDLSMLGWGGGRSVRGNFSILFKGRGTSRAGELLLIDHNARTVDDLFADMSEEAVEASVDEMLKDREYVNQVREREISLTQALNRGKPVTRTVEGYACTKYTARYKMIIEKQRRQSLVTREDTTSFNDYFKHALGDIDSYHPRFCGSKTSLSGDVEAPSKNARKTSRQDVSSSEQNYKATVYVADKYPLKYNQFLPLLHVLGYTSQHIGKFVEFLSQSRFDGLGFPIKVSVPMFYTVVAHLTLKSLQFLDPAAEFMNVDSAYSPPVVERSAERAETRNDEVLLYNPVIVTSLASPKYSNDVQRLGEAEDRLQCTSNDYNNENDASILRAEREFETLLHKPETESDAEQEEKKETPDFARKDQTTEGFSKLAEERLPQKEEANYENAIDEYHEPGRVNEIIVSHRILKVKTLHDVILLYKSERNSVKDSDSLEYSLSENEEERKGATTNLFTEKVTSGTGKANGRKPRRFRLAPGFRSNNPSPSRDLERDRSRDTTKPRGILLFGGESSARATGEEAKAAVTKGKAATRAGRLVAAPGKTLGRKPRCGLGKTSSAIPHKKTADVDVFMSNRTGTAALC